MGEFFAQTCSAGRLILVAQPPSAVALLKVDSAEVLELSS
jgi:hypothetical protein